MRTTQRGERNFSGLRLRILGVGRLIKSERPVASCAKLTAMNGGLCLVGALVERRIDPLVALRQSGARLLLAAEGWG